MQTTLYKRTKNIAMGIIITLLMMLPIVPAAAQGVAEVWLNKAVEKLQNKGTEIAFRINEEGMRFSGKLLMEGQKFAYNTDEMKIWYDGTTQWTLQQQSGYNEVYINTPTIEELQNISPYLLLSSYKEHFTATDGGEKVLNGKPCHRVTLEAINEKQELSSIDIYIHSDGSLAALEFTTSIGHPYTVEVRTVRNGLTFSKDLFTYPEKEFPADEVIDMR